MTNNIGAIIERLQDIYERAINSKNGPRDFFLILFEYLTIYDEEPLFETPIESIVTKGKEDTKNLNQFADKAIKEMKKVYEEVSSYVKRGKITNLAVVNNLNQFKSLEDGILATSQGPVLGRYGYLAYVLMSLVEDKTKNYIPFTKKYGSVSNEGKIEKWNFSPSYDEWEQENNRLERIQLTKVWYSWDKLALFFKLYRDFEKWQKEILANNKVWDALNLGGMFGEIKDILANKKSERGVYFEFEEGDYRNHLQRVHSYIKQYLADMQETGLPVNRIPYNLVDNLLIINGKEVKLQKDRRKLRLLGLLSETPKGFYYSEVVEQVEGADSSGIKDLKNTYYEVCRGLTNSIARVGITDFLQYDFNQAKINPKYKKSSK